jgi:hypothetical protein
MAMKKERKAAQCWDSAYSAQNGALFGIAAASLYYVYRAMTNQIPENILAHVLGELVAFALGGTVLFAAASAL